jgi:PAS domain S-box-containing protein
MQIQKIIEQLGFTAKEAKVYLAALHLGEAHISDIAEKVNLPRSSTQTIADRLNKEELLNFYVMRRYKYWVAANPEHLLDRLQQREETMRDAMPVLSAIKRARSGEQRENKKIQLGLFHVFADSSLQPVIIVNKNVEIEYVNSAWEKQYGYTLEEVQGKNPGILKSGRTPDDVYKRLWIALKAEKMFQTDEIIDEKKDGTFFSLITTIFPVRYNGLLFYIQILDDFTEKNK